MKLNEIVNNTFFGLAFVGAYGILYSAGAIKEGLLEMPVLYASEALYVLGLTIRMVPKNNEDNLFPLK